MLSSLSSHCFGIRSFPGSVTEAFKVKNIQESKGSLVFKVYKDLFLFKHILFM